MRRTQDTLMAQLKEVALAKPRTKNDESLVAEISQLESELALARDELVGQSE